MKQIKKGKTKDKFWDVAMSEKSGKLYLRVVTEVSPITASQFIKIKEAEEVRRADINQYHMDEASIGIL